MTHSLAPTDIAMPELADDMIFVPGGTFNMGSNDHYPEEAPVREVQVDPFLIDSAPVTNRQFAEFVRATGYVTLAERPPNAEDYPGILPEMLHAGSLVFVPPASLDALAPNSWWHYVRGAQWRHPAGAGSTLDGLQDHPVVHIAYCDALAYAGWAGKSLPSEAQWEYACRAGRENTVYPWGDTRAPNGALMANYWHGAFPMHNTSPDGFMRTSPIQTYPPNSFGLYDMIGNVWEWTTDVFQSAAGSVGATCCAAPDQSSPHLERVMKGGSHLCADNYCRRYRPAARHPQPSDTSTSHLGFRCIKTLDAST
ncbi:formylglycine-generating enzyme family protein [Cognatishimia sp. SS12]|uniref:formylglycine-generating enzyme family protein n=1 Tax=Cognatishimia sp. SS12 TaxID=2979465 RepID=UPI00232EAB8D|nr:formylglycine-generating enzyme family protein [Cognatishimia sp. SS12]MDC0739387.1 formylglycine-generating enzyme family protein [Cognatishimia sp. SS12]